MKGVLAEWGMRCPKCRSSNFLKVEVKVWANLSANGTDPEGDQEGDDFSGCECTNCRTSGIVDDFKV